MGSRLNETFTQNKMRNRRSKLGTESPSDVLKISRVQTSKPQSVSGVVDFGCVLYVPFLAFPCLPMVFPHFLAENSRHFTFFICQLRWALTPHQTDWENWVIALLVTRSAQDNGLEVSANWWQSNGNSPEHSYHFGCYTHTRLYSLHSRDVYDDLNPSQIDHLDCNCLFLLRNWTA